MEENAYAPHAPTVAADFDESITDLVEHLLATKVPRGEAPKREDVERAKTMMIGIAAPLPNGFKLNVDPEDFLAEMAVHLLQNANETWQPDWDLNTQRIYPNAISGEEKAIYEKQLNISIRCHFAIGEAFGRVLYGWRDEKIRALGEWIRKFWRLAFK